MLTSEPIVKIEVLKSTIDEIMQWREEKLKEVFEENIEALKEEDRIRYEADMNNKEPSFHYEILQKLHAYHSEMNDIESMARRRLMKALGYVENKGVSKDGIRDIFHMFYTFTS
jgi:hypothetical protein